MKNTPTINGFGKRLALFRKAKGFSQKELGEHIGVSNRVISYYERESKYPPAHLIAPLANILEVTTDELLELTEIKTDYDTPNAALQRKLRLIESLPKKDQKAILHHIDLAIKSKKYEEVSSKNHRVHKT